MPPREQPEETRPIQREALLDLVQNTRDERITARIPRGELLTLLEQERDLAGGTPPPIDPLPVAETPATVEAPTELARGTPLPSTMATTERLWRRGSGTRLTEPIVIETKLVLAFASALVAGLLLTVPLWW